jgi:hypothetical protein
VEARVSTTFSLKEKDTYSKRGNLKIPHRDGIDFFHREKFNHQFVREKIQEIFGNSKYCKILVVWNTEDNFAQLPQIAKQKYDFEVRGLRGIIHDLTQKRVTFGSRDDVLRIMELVSLVEHEEKAFRKKIDNFRGQPHHEDKTQNEV